MPNHKKLKRKRKRQLAAQIAKDESISEFEDYQNILQLEEQQRKEWEEREKIHQQKLKAKAEKNQQIRAKQKETSIYGPMASLKKGNILENNNILTNTILEEISEKKENCSFFLRYGSCKFASDCKFSHPTQYYSTTLVIEKMFPVQGCSLPPRTPSEDAVFNEFLIDVLPEFIQFGDILSLKICCNECEYLYGNVYIEYFDVLSAIHAKNHLSGRFFASKVLYPQFFLTLGLSLRTCKEFEQSGLCFNKNCQLLHFSKFPVPLGSLIKSILSGISEGLQENESRITKWKYSELNSLEPDVEQTLPKEDEEDSPPIKKQKTV